MKALFVVLSGTLLLSLAACQKPAEPVDTPSAAAVVQPANPSPRATKEPAEARLPRFHWRLSEATDAQGRKLAALFTEGEPIQLDFAQSHLSIDHLCNRMFGGYTLRGAQLELGRLASTRMACTDPARTEQERAASDLFNGTLTLAVERMRRPRC